MPIRINLLAEAQAAEDLRRRDPVKRAIWVGCFLIALMLAWASLLQARIAINQAQVSRLEGKIKALEPEHDRVVETQKTLSETRQKLAALDRLSQSRYLSGNLLDALQRAYVEDVRMVKFKSRFNYVLTPATKAKTNAFNVTPAKPATATERITVQIEAVDASSNPGDQVNDYKETLTALDHFDAVFQDQERDIRLTGLNPPQTDPSGRQYVLFTVECAYPETVR
jgi:hypothetical protein